jgi:predicted GH43/DUF377 family glycosyl hydrolase
VQDVSRVLVTRSEIRLTADPARVLARLFVPGLELGGEPESRATGVLGRILLLPEEQVAATLADVRARYRSRHRDLDAVFARHYGEIAHRIPPGPPLSEDRKALLGAFFTHEFSVEGAALFNPSVVLHPDQSGTAPGEARVVLSVRAVGEGHLSSVEFRTGVVGPGPVLRLDEPGPHLEAGVVGRTTYDLAVFSARLVEEGADAESSRFLLGRLPVRFALDDLEGALSALIGQRVTRHGGAHTEELARRIVRSSYRLEFAAESALAERVLWPESPSESNGIEDVRLVRFVEPDGHVRFLATYTAYDGLRVLPKVFETSDFRSFQFSEVAGPAAKNKGMALFPRKVGGQYLSLSRWDRESCSLSSSSDGRLWSDATTIHTPERPWELIQTGNCGSPLETDAGWLVLTHGVGPMREYAIGALLLDLDDPARVIGSLPTPLLVVEADERDGYVPNVVYSCGGLIHDDQLLLPYGASDASVRFAFVPVPELLDRMLAPAT